MTKPIHFVGVWRQLFPSLPVSVCPPVAFGTSECVRAHTCDRLWQGLLEANAGNRRFHGPLAVYWRIVLETLE